LEEKVLKILVVEDDKSMRETLRYLLSWDRKQKVYTAESAAEAKELLGREDFALVMADYRLKGGGDGLDVLFGAKERNPNVITILITAYGNDRLAIRAVAEGVYDYLTKPFKSVLEVKNTVARGLRYYRLLTRYREKVADVKLQKELLQETMEKTRRTRKLLRMLVNKLQQQ
jgi:two-component system response regulator AtoC